MFREPQAGRIDGHINTLLARLDVNDRIRGAEAARGVRLTSPTGRGSVVVAKEVGMIEQSRMRGRIERLRERHRDRKQRRTWRRERRRGWGSLDDAVNTNESNLFKGGFITKK